MRAALMQDPAIPSTLLSVQVHAPGGGAQANAKIAKPLAMAELTKCIEHAFETSLGGDEKAATIAVPVRIEVVPR
jgi:hypothetical protein